MGAHGRVLSSPKPAVVVTELADSSVNLALRAWTKTPDYWTVHGDLTGGIFLGVGGCRRRYPLPAGGYPPGRDELTPPYFFRSVHA